MKIQTLNINTLEMDNIGEFDTIRLVADDNKLDISYRDGKWTISTVEKTMSINPIVSNAIEVFPRKER